MSGIRHRLTVIEGNAMPARTGRRLSPEQRARLTPDELAEWYELNRKATELGGLDQLMKQLSTGEILRGLELANKLEGIEPGACSSQWPEEWRWNDGDDRTAHRLD